MNKTTAVFENVLPTGSSANIPATESAAIDVAHAAKGRAHERNRNRPNAAMPISGRATLMSINDRAPARDAICSAGTASPRLTCGSVMLNGAVGKYRAPAAETSANRIAKRNEWTTGCTDWV